MTPPRAESGETACPPPCTYRVHGPLAPPGPRRRCEFPVLQTPRDCFAFATEIVLRLDVPKSRILYPILVPLSSLHSPWIIPIPPGSGVAVGWATVAMGACASRDSPDSRARAHCWRRARPRSTRPQELPHRRAAPSWAASGARRPQRGKVLESRQLRRRPQRGEACSSRGTSSTSGSARSAKPLPKNSKTPGSRVAHARVARARRLPCHEPQAWLPSRKTRPGHPRVTRPIGVLGAAIHGTNSSLSVRGALGGAPERRPRLWAWP